jgi:hypothetical protein
MTESESTILAIFPRLAEHGFTITSPRDTRYNCIAWAAGNSTHWWQPGVGGQPLGGYYWPTLNVQSTLETFERAFATLGYERCQTGDYELGYEKVAIYVHADGIATHAARQLEDGTWVSKLGKLEDIHHVDVEGVCGKAYGEVALFMRRESTKST